LLDSHLETPIC